MSAQPLDQYITEVDKIYRTGNATEHSYRPALKTLFENLTKGLTITNEPKHIECGAPDYIITRDSIPVGYIEAKDITVGLDNKLNKEQFDRYRQSLNNLIITDYLMFRYYVDGHSRLSVTIAHENKGVIIPEKAQYDSLIELVNMFTNYSGKTITTSESLAAIMADKSKLLAEVINKALKDKSAPSNTLTGQYEGFRKILLHNLGLMEFSDIYAQTLAYGLFAARLNQTDNQTFTRILAAHLIPQSNPFLRRFFNHIAGIDLDLRIVWIVDALADIFNYVAVEDIKKEFLKANQDPYIHFYETFLGKYDTELRETRGVYYTPLPVVQFIVRAVDDILQKEFGVAQGLADNSKIKLPVKDTDQRGEPVTVGEQEFHKVQILDPATGTGTFLAEVIHTVYSRFANQQGMWAGYCKDHLIPRLNGFEILMASYAMAHFKLDMTLRETGFHWNNEQNGESRRLHVYLTNTLEEAPDGVPELFMAQWLAREAEEARRVKRDTPVMVVMGNPPYNVSTQNKNDWIDALITEYKKNLDERNIQPLSDDYIKFIRYGQYLIEKNTNGILAYISNNSFIDGLIHRQMRKKLLECFDKIYILDLHGNVNRKETTSDGGKDENVFDIQQGVSINIFIKTTNSIEPAKVYHCDLFGKREEKYRFLFTHDLSSIKWKKVKPDEPHYFFIPKNFSLRTEYEKGFGINTLFPVYSSGVKTHDDNNLVNIKPFPDKNNHLYNYRPFDTRFINYDLKKVKRHRYNIMRHFLEVENVGLIVSRQAATNNWSHVQVSNTIIDNRIHYSNRGISVLMPLYLYPEKENLDKTEKRRPNLNNEIVQTIAQKTGLQFTEEKIDDEKTFAPIDILDYIYAVLQSPVYRTKYKEFLKIDFPRIPYPVNTDEFCRLAAFGSILRNLHLMENVSPSHDKASFPVAGSNEITTQKYENGKVFINRNQYFDNVPLEAWEFYIGGYQPAKKWLKDRNGKILIFDEIEHYRKIITVLSLTMDIQQQIDGGT